MEKLLALIAEAGEDEDILIKFTDATWSDASLALQLSVSIFGSSSTMWEVRCEDVLAYVLCSESAYWLEMTEDHPLLWEHKNETASAFFYSSPANPDAAVGALYEAHQNAVGNWIRFGQYLNNPLGLSKLLAAGNGLLAEAPLPLLALYQESLRPHGVELDIRFAHPPRTWDGTQWRQLDRRNTKALLMGRSYVIGNGWIAHQKS